jgi:transposase InsO family protein
VCQKKIKTDNGPVYISKTFTKFLNQWNVEYVTEIPYNPQGQTIIERTHQVLKNQLDRVRATNQF